MLALLCFFVLDCCVSAHGVEVGSHGFRTEHLRILKSEHLLGHGLHCFTSDSGACGVIDTTGSVAVCRGFDFREDVLGGHRFRDGTLVHEDALKQTLHHDCGASSPAQCIKCIARLAKDGLEARKVKGRLHEAANLRSH